MQLIISVTKQGRDICKKKKKMRERTALDEVEVAVSTSVVAVGSVVLPSLRTTRRLPQWIFL